MHISECLLLSNSTIHSCILHSGTSDFLFCENLPHVHSKHSYRIVARKQTAIKNGSFSLAEYRMIVTHVPSLELLSFQDGVCFIPSTIPYPNGLLVFWAHDEASQSDVLKPFIWNSTSMLHDWNLGSDIPSFRTLVQRLAGTWSKVTVTVSFWSWKTLVYRYPVFLKS